MSNFYTSIKQSKKLIELGLDVNTADMWYDVMNNPRLDKREDYQFAYIPAWSIISLLDWIKKNYPDYYMEINSDCGMYHHWNIMITTYQKGVIQAIDKENLIDVIVEIICKILTNNLE